MLLEDGDAVETDNVLIQQVKTSESDIVDVVGYPSPEVEVTGTGKAWLLRDGKLVIGTWERGSEGDVTVFHTKKGDEFQLKPGTTFVELAPTGMFTAPVTFGS
jgi:predicted XRE-type DNA-binding protein